MKRSKSVTVNYRKLGIWNRHKGTQ